MRVPSDVSFSHCFFRAAQREAGFANRKDLLTDLREASRIVIATRCAELAVSVPELAGNTFSSVDKTPHEHKLGTTTAAQDSDAFTGMDHETIMKNFELCVRLLFLISLFLLLLISFSVQTPKDDFLSSSCPSFVDFSSVCVL